MFIALKSMTNVMKMYLFEFNNFRWAEAITYSKKGIRVSESGDVATLLSLYGRLIEAQVKSNCYEG